MARRDKRSWFVGGSLLVHLSLFFALQAAALRPQKPKPKNVELQIVKAPPPVEEAPPPAEPEPEKKKPLDLTKKVEVVKQPKNEVPPEAPPAEEPPTPPVFGLSLSSTGQNADGFNARVGNTTMSEPGEKVTPKEVKPLGGEGTGRGPVSIAQVSKRPERIGDCPPFDPAELYPQDAREREIEGQVRLEVTIAEDGHVAEVKVTKGLGYGLDEIAASTIRKHCRFQAAEIAGEKVATKIPYTFTFVLPD